MIINLIILFIVVLSVITLTIFLFQLSKTRKQQTLSSESLIQTLQNQINLLERTLHENMNQMHGHQKELSHHLLNQHTESSKLFGKVQTSLGNVQSLTQQFTHLGRELSSLQKLFEIPKRRGIFGEDLLKRLLEDILPKERFALQHRIGSDVIVDVAIFLSKDKELCIDAKFPLPSYQKYIEASEEEKENHLKQLARDMKKHISNIASRYIRPDLNTLPFALMYIPAESIYYDLFVTQIDAAFDQTIKAAAFSKQVYAVSPNTLYMFLQLINFGFRQEVTEKHAWEMIQQVTGLSVHIGKFQDHVDGIKRYLDYAQKRVNDLETILNRFRKDFDQIQASKEIAEKTTPKQLPTIEA